MNRVLVISASLTQADELHHLISRGKLRDAGTFEIRYPSSLSAAELDAKTLLEDCLDVIKEEDINVIISIHPGLQLVHAAILHHYPELKGPSFESVFLCLNRLYNKEVITSGFSQAYQSLDVIDVSPEESAFVIGDFGVPCLLKEGYNLEGSYSKKIRHIKSVSGDLVNIIPRLRHSVDYASYFVGNYMREAMDAYPQALEMRCIVEEYIRPGRRTGTLHMLEACITAREVIPWVICDVTHYKQRPFLVRSVTVPTSLDDALHCTVWAVFREVAQGLIDKGFDNQFLQMEMLVSSEGSVRVLEMLPCLNRLNVPLYRHVFINGDSLGAQIEAGLGRSTYTPKALSCRGALRATVHAQAYGIPLDEVVDLTAMKALKEFEVVHKVDNQAIISPEDAGEDGVPVANIHLEATSVAECFDKMRDMCSRVLKSFEPAKEHGRRYSMQPEAIEGNGKTRPGATRGMGNDKRLSIP